MVTETDALARALDEAAERWPEDAGSRRRLLLHLVDEGHSTLKAAREERSRQRQRTLQECAGVLVGAFDPGERERLREEWPE